MNQMIFRIPFPGLVGGIPIYSFGLIMCTALFACAWLVGRWARKEGIAPDRIYDLALWIFVGVVIGARIVSKL